MAKLDIQAGTTSVTLQVFVQASTSTAGLGLTGLTATAAGLQAWYYRGTGTAVPITLATSSLTAAYTSGLFVEVNSTATGIQGLYRFDPPDAAFASGVRSVVIGLGGAASMAPVPLEIQLTGWNNQVAVQTAVLAQQVHTAAIIPIVQTASNLGGTVVLAGQVHTNAVIPLVQTASNLSGTVVLAGQVHTGAIVPIVQTASNLGGTVVLAQQVHTAAIIPVVQTASVSLVANAVGTASGVAPVTLASGQELVIASAVGTAIQDEAYPGTGTGGKSLAQMGYASLQHLGESNIVYSGTGTLATKSVLKLDQTTTAMTYNITISSSTEPTGVSRAS